MNKSDIFKIERRSQAYIDCLTNGTFSKYPTDNEIVLKFVNAKFQGNYRHILYDCNCPEKTVYKNIIVLRKVIGLIQKPLIELTEDDIILLQNKLNQNKVYKDGTKTPISMPYKKDIVKCFKQFWTFYRAYAKFEEGKIVENISEFFRVRKDKNYNLLVKFLTKDEIMTLANHSHNLKMRALIQLFFESGARTIEILNLRKHNCQFDTQKNRWMIKLPNMKGMSSAKMPIEIEYAHKDFDAWMQYNTFTDDEYIFNYSYDYVRVYLAQLGKKKLGRKVTPKMFRKSCAMYLVNLDINEQYIKSHMGWSASSKAISHYIDQKSIQKPDKLKSTFVGETSGELEDLKNRLKQMEAMLLQKFADGF